MGEIEERAFLKTIQSYTADKNLPLAAIVDVDGTVALPGDDLNDVSTYTPYQPVVGVVQALWAKGYKIVVVTARPESLYSQTFAWFIRNVCPFDDLVMAPEASASPKRKAKIKYALFNEKVRNRYCVDIVLDDEDAVVAMWRAMGLVCLDPDGK